MRCRAKADQRSEAKQLSFCRRRQRINYSQENSSMGQDSWRLLSLFCLINVSK